MTPVFYDILKNVWILRNPQRQAESIEVRPYSIPSFEVEGRHMAMWK